MINPNLTSHYWDRVAEHERYMDRMESKENSPRVPTDGVTCPDCNGEGDGGEVSPDGDPQNAVPVACDRCGGLCQVDWDDLSEDEQIEHLQAEVDMLRERLEPVPLFDDLGFDAEEVA